MCEVLLHYWNEKLSRNGSEKGGARLGDRILPWISLAMWIIISIMKYWKKKLEPP